jgi:electron transport complex protein RnfD
MPAKNKFVVSHAPFWHNGDTIAARNLHTLIAAAPAAVFGIIKFGPIGLGVLGLCISCCMLWELLLTKAMGRKPTVGDLDAAVIGMLMGMMLPANFPWWGVLVGGFVTMVVGKMMFGGPGGAPFHPSLIGVAVLGVSWGAFMDFDARYLNYEFSHLALFPLGAVKYLGPDSVAGLSATDLLMGHQTGALGAVFGLGIILGGLYLLIRGYTRWEITVSFILGIVVTSLLFQKLGADGKFAGPMVHLLSGYTLLGAFFLVHYMSARPVNLIAMILYGAGAGIMSILIRNIGSYSDGVVYAILILSVVQPLLDKIRPKALGKVVKHA